MTKTFWMAPASLVATIGLWAAATGGAPAWENDLRPITAAEWNYERAAHLLERAGFGGTPEEIQQLAKMTPQAAVKQLVRYQQTPNDGMPEFNASGIFQSTDFVPPTEGQGSGLKEGIAKGEIYGIKLEKKTGTMWVQPAIDYGYYLRFSNNMEIQRVTAYFAQRMLVTKRPMEEKIAVFWHGHFANENDKVRDYRKMMAQWDTYRRLGNGNFGELLLAMTQDPAMSIYLDGRLNVKGHPNENFAREIMELFSLGVGNYTEKDIKEAARAFSGWGLDGNKFIVRAALHDDGEKTLLGQTGNFDGTDVVKILLKQPSCARFISRKLYRYFVRDEVTPAFEEQLASVLRKNNYELAPLLETVFLSRDFYSESSMGTQVKGPVQLVVSTYKKLGLTEVPTAPAFHQTTAGLGQALCVPPNVAGWKGGRTWMNPATMLERENFSRYVFFPREIPPSTRKPLDYVADIIGQRAYEQMNEMAKRGDYSSPPDQAESDSGFNRRQYSDQTYNIFRGVYNGAILTLKRMKHDPPSPAKVDLVGMVRTANLKDTGAVIDYFGRRFLSVPLAASDRTRLVQYLNDRLGQKAIDLNREGLEKDLRETLHLVLSMPEYQLA
jgi:uncharacterized protein (DUF1800 family)